MTARQTALERYCKRIVKGQIRACKKVKAVCSRLLLDIEAKDGRWHFDRAKAERAVDFIEQFCKMPSGRLGKPFILEDYEKAWVEAIFGFVDDEGLRRYQEVLIVVGRKNGKTSLAAAIELYMLISDGEGAPQIYNVATKEEQAKLAFNACVKMVRQSGLISKRVRKRTDDLYCAGNFGFIKPLSSATSSLDGLDSHMVVIDELAAIVNRDLYDLMKQSMAAREQPLLLCITTNGFVRNGIFDAQYSYAERWLNGEVKDERFLAFIYELDSRDEWLDPKCWIKANPGLGTVKKKEALRGYVEKAKADPSFRPTVLTKDFNMPENSAVAWLSFEEAVNETRFDVREMGFKYGIVGFDASDTIDLTAAKMLMMRQGDDHIYELSMYWIPESVLEAQDNSGSRVERDRAPYRLWIERGLMRVVPGNKIPKSVVVDWMQEIESELGIYAFAIGVDPWHIDDGTERDLRAFVGDSRYIEVRQGPQTLSQPMKQLQADLKDNRIVDNHNPVNEWCRMNAQVRADGNDNIQLVKKLNDPRNRIDGIMAEVDAYAVLCNMQDDYLAMC